MPSSSQFRFLSDILVVIGEVSLVSLIVPYLTSSGPNPAAFAWGIFATIAAWLVGLLMSRDITK